MIGAKDKKEKELAAVLAAPQARGGRRGGRRFGGGRGGPALPPSLWKSHALKLAIIGIDFADITHNANNTPAALNKLFFGESSKKKSSGASLADYLREVSAGQLKLDTGKAVAWVKVAKKRGEYVQGSGTSNRNAPLVNALNKLTSGEHTDALKDVDAIAFVYAGNRMRSNRGSVFFPHAGTILHQSRRLPYMLIPEGGSRLTQLSGIAKEAGLMLGLPELTARGN